MTDKRAMIKVTGIGSCNTFMTTIETSTDLPADAFGEVVTETVNKLWRAGEDMKACTIVITFGDVIDQSENRKVRAPLACPTRKTRKNKPVNRETKRRMAEVDNEMANAGFVPVDD